MIFFVKNVALEGPGTFEKFLAREERDYRIIDMNAGEGLPSDLDNCEAVVVLGGPMSVYEEERYPFLREEDAFIKRLLAGRVPFLGICLGAQLLAKAAGARVIKAPQKEIGFFPVTLLEAAKGDALFTGIESPVEVFQWHEDMFQLPEHGVLLASSPNCPFQAFRVGPCAYGVQFHLEVAETDIRAWAEAYIPLGEEGEALKRKMINDFSLKKESFSLTMERFYKNFTGIVDKKGKHDPRFVSSN